MEPFFTHTCRKCGVTDEAKFYHAGPHLKQVCNFCGFYVKFFDKSKVPDVKEIKLKIFALADKNLEAIETGKKEIGFVSGLTGLNEKLQYLNLYLHFR
jgi:hypothetical protein